MIDIIIAAIVAAMLGLAITYIIKKKKSGAVCIGCPDSGSCSRSGCGCGCQSDK